MRKPTNAYDGRTLKITFQKISPSAGGTKVQNNPKEIIIEADDQSDGFVSSGESMGSVNDSILKKYTKKRPIEQFEDYYMGMDEQVSDDDDNRIEKKYIQKSEDIF
jgi:hypothetical protein